LGGLGRTMDGQARDDHMGGTADMVNMVVGDKNIVSTLQPFGLERRTRLGTEADIQDPKPASCPKPPARWAFPADAREDLDPRGGAAQVVVQIGGAKVTHGGPRSGVRWRAWCRGVLERPKGDRPRRASLHRSGRGWGRTRQGSRPQSPRS